MLLDRLFDNLGLRILPFAICRVRQGWRLEMTEAGEAHLHFVVEGSGYLLAPRSFREALSPFTLVVVPPGIGHRVEPAGVVVHDLTIPEALCRAAPTGFNEIVAGEGLEGLVMTCGRLSATYGDALGLFDHLREPIVERFDDSPEVRVLFEQLLREQASSAPGAARMTRALMEQCLIHLLRRLMDAGEPTMPWLAALEHPGFARVLGAILDDPAAAHTLDSLAATAGMSRSVFSERFHSAFGMSAVELVRATRLRRAALLLQTTDLPVKTVARRVGFSSRSHFSKAFREVFGREPAGFRAE